MAMQTQTPQPSPTQGSTGRQSLGKIESGERIDAERRELRSHYQEAGVPIWGVFLILIGVVAVLGNFGWNLGWLFGLALGAWFVYLGAREVPAGGQINWWLVGLGLLIGLGSVSSGFTDRLVFPLVLIIVGAGILGQQYLRRPAQ